MITLSELIDQARKDFPGAERSLALLLMAWARSDPGEELVRLLEGTGISKETLLLRLEPQRDLISAENKEILSRCILQVRNGPVLALHLLKALCQHPDSRIGRLLGEAGLRFDRLDRNLAGQMKRPWSVLAGQGCGVREQSHLLAEYGRDLTALAEKRTFDGLCERPEEVEQVLEVLLRKNKENVILTGPAGVGKTALVELLAGKLLTTEAPPALKGARIYEVSMSKLVAGTRYRGDFEQRMHSVIQSIESCDRVILFIDEIHLIQGAGSAEGVIMDAASILKPFLARSSLRVIGATTAEEYHRTIARDPALARRFQELRLKEPGEELTAKMAQAQARALERHHGVVFQEEVILRAIGLTDRYLPNRFQPDKTIDLLDIVCVAVTRKGRKEVTLSDLLSALARQTGHPMAALRADDHATLRHLVDELKRRVVGQDHAVQRVAETLSYRRQALGGKPWNLGTFLFVGETGVGKTELARAIAEVFFGRRSALLRLDLAEYQQGSSVNRLIGSPMGYMDANREGVLTAWLRAEGNGVILLEKVEKAHLEVQSLFFGLLDEGKVTSLQGEQLDCRQCVVILTTNAVKPTIGFAQSAIQVDPTGLIMEHFPSEFLTRLDEVILFRSLGEEEIKHIILLFMGEAFEQLRKRKAYVICDERRLCEHLAGFVSRNRSGARGIQRILDQKVMQPIFMALLHEKGQAELDIVLTDAFYEKGIVSVKDRNLFK